MLDYIGGLKIYGVTSFTGKNALKKSNFKQNSCKKVLVYVIGWQAVVFGINSSCIVNRKEIVRGELLPIYIPCSHYLSQIPQPAILLQINPTSIATVA